MPNRGWDGNVRRLACNAARTARHALLPSCYHYRDSGPLAEDFQNALSCPGDYSNTCPTILSI